ncbi:MAG TPA: pyridoxal-dependent decarboxylase, partial [Candidatus Angelobacter sp.]
WLLTPIDLSAFYTRRPDILRRAFSLVPEYLHLQDDPRAHNLMDYGVPLGHRFRALKFWYVLHYFGLERIQAMLRSHMQWARDLAALVDAHPDFERVAPVPFSVVCFRYKGSDEENKKILEEINATGRMFLSHTVLNGRVVIRMAIGNLATQWEDVLEAWQAIVSQIGASGHRKSNPSSTARFSELLTNLRLWSYVFFTSLRRALQLISKHGRSLPFRCTDNPISRCTDYLALSSRYTP